MEIENIIFTLRQKFEEIARYNNKDYYEKTLINVSRYFESEIISSEDMIYTKVSENNEATLYILTKKLIVKLVVADYGLNYRTEHIIYRDIKKVAVTESSVNIYFHGLHAPQIIEVDDYKEALKLQRHLTAMRDRKFSINENKRKY